MYHSVVQAGGGSGLFGIQSHCSKDTLTSLGRGITLLLSIFHWSELSHMVFLSCKEG